MLASTVLSNVTNHKNQCAQVDKNGKTFGKEQCAAAVEGKFVEAMTCGSQSGRLSADCRDAIRRPAHSSIDCLDDRADLFLSKAST
jgi:hypothetical protein